MKSKVLGLTILASVVVATANAEQFKSFEIVSAECCRYIRVIESKSGRNLHNNEMNTDLKKLALFQIGYSSRSPEE